MQAKTRMDAPTKVQPPTQQHINPLPAPNANANATNYDSNDSTSSTDDECNANELLQQCIQAGITKATASIQPTTQANNVMKIPPNPVAAIRRSQLPTPRATTSSSHRSRSKIQQHPYGCDVNEQPQQTSNGNSKNFPATSANVSRTAGAPDVVMAQTTGTDYAPDQHQRDDVSAQTMTSTKNDLGRLAAMAELAKIIFSRECQNIKISKYRLKHNF